MSWVNLNDTYVNKTGDTIAGDLSVNGALNVNDGKGAGTTYNVANEITALRDSVSKVTVGDSAGHITFNKSPNGHFEIWFNTGTESVCIYFNTDSIGVYDAATQSGFYFPKPQHPVSSTFIDCKMNNIPNPITDAAVSFASYQDWGNPGITATMDPYGGMIIQVTTAFPNKIPWSCIFVCKQCFDTLFNNDNIGGATGTTRSIKI